MKIELTEKELRFIRDGLNYVKSRTEATLNVGVDEKMLDRLRDIEDLQDKLGEDFNE